MAMPDVEANFVQHIPCPHCGSSDANAEYDDGHSFCFSCETYTPPEEGEKPTGDASPAPQLQTAQDTEQKAALLTGEAKAIPARGLTVESCQKYGYLTGVHNGQPVQMAVYRDKHGKPVAQKLRNANKHFSIIGDGKQLRLFGSHLWLSLIHI